MDVWIWCWWMYMSFDKMKKKTLSLFLSKYQTKSIALWLMLMYGAVLLLVNWQYGAILGLFTIYKRGNYGHAMHTTANRDTILFFLIYHFSKLLMIWKLYCFKCVIRDHMEDPYKLFECHVLSITHGFICRVTNNDWSYDSLQFKCYHVSKSLSWTLSKRQSFVLRGRGIQFLKKNILVLKNLKKWYLGIHILENQ